MNPEILFVMKAERDAESQRQSPQPMKDNWFVQLFLKNAARSNRSRNDSGCQDSSSSAAEQAR
jgi:hypothetical protein